MKRRFINLFLLFMTFMTGLAYGYWSYRRDIFPYRQTRRLYSQISSYFFHWTIGVYEGPTPFELTPAKDTHNPVLTRIDVTDIDAGFVADPFLLVDEGSYNMFFEVLNRETGQGDIAYAVSSDGREWEYRKVIIDEPFHLSYPYVFKWKDDFYLIPESGEDLSVRLYKAVSFPDKWEYLGNLLSGYNYTDPSVFRHDDMWWMFVSSIDGTLNLYSSEDLLDGWSPHPKNPIVKSDMRISRPAGRVFSYDDKLYRLTQNGYPSYGLEVFAFEIKELTLDSYEEEIASDTPLIGGTGRGWNSGRMHHIDLYKLGDRWMGVVDGRNK